MGSVSGSSVSFEKFLALLKEDVLVMGDHEIMAKLGELMHLKRRFQIDRDLRHEQEAIILMDVCKVELKKRGCFVSEFGDV